MSGSAAKPRRKDLIRGIDHIHLSVSDFGRSEALQAPDRAAVETCHEILAGLGVEVTEPAVYAEYNPEYYAIFFADPDGLRLEIVARTPYRATLADRWDELDTFLNPLASLSTPR